MHNRHILILQVFCSCWFKVLIGCMCPRMCTQTHSHHTHSHTRTQPYTQMCQEHYIHTHTEVAKVLLCWQFSGGKAVLRFFKYTHLIRNSLPLTHTHTEIHTHTGQTDWGCKGDRFGGSQGREGPMGNIYIFFNRYIQYIYILSIF